MKQRHDTMEVEVAEQKLLHAHDDHDHMSSSDEEDGEFVTRGGGGLCVFTHKDELSVVGFPQFVHKLFYSLHEIK